MLLRLILTCSAGATALPGWHLDARPPWEAVLASWDRESNFSRPRPMLIERRPVHAWNRYLLQFYRPLCKPGDRSCLWRIAERLGTQGLRELREISPVENLEEALETLIQLTGPLFNDNVDDIQEAPTSMMDHW